MEQALKNLEALAKNETLNPWEKTFVADVLARKEERGDCFSLSEKQIALINKIQDQRSEK